MKIEINTQEKKIILLENANLGELFAFLEEILPDLKWREYSIEGSVVNNWAYPIINPIVPYTPQTPINPWNPSYPWITYSTSTGEIK